MVGEAQKKFERQIEKAFADTFSAFPYVITVITTYGFFK